MKSKKNMKLELMCGLVIMLFIVVILVKTFAPSKENFIANVEQYELSKDDDKYYFYNPHMLVNDKNPVIFNSLEEVRKFEKKYKLKEHNVVDLVVDNKVNEDPQENYERQCAKKIAPINAQMNTCYAYLKNDKKMDELNLLFSTINDVDRDIESCQMKKVVEDNPELGKIDNEIKYMTQFY